MARSIPKALDGSLHQHTAGGTSLDPIMIGTAAWYSWLEQHRSFCFEAGRMTFTARKEQRPGGPLLVCVPTQPWQAAHCLPR